MKITINEPPRSKKNSMQIIKLGNRYSLTPSKAYKEYKRACGQYLIGWAAPPIDYPINLKCVFYMPTHRRCDKTNLESAICDILVDYGILADDSRDIVASTDGGRVFYDKTNPRTEIEITPYDGEYEIWKS